ncbi:hypothetical protein MTO96_023520 [Rhipicephalus appendiculatus]
MVRVRRMTTPEIPGGPRRCVVRLSTSRFAFFALFLLLCLAAPHGVASAYGAARVTGEDVSLIEWSHGTNSRWKLEQALSGRAAPYVEADVSQADGMAVMAHPPVRSWDLSLREFLRIVCGTPRNVTLKLDFKASEVLESAFLDMESAPLENLRDLWLNADIVEGPGGRPRRGCTTLPAAVHQPLPTGHPVARLDHASHVILQLGSRRSHGSAPGLRTIPRSPGHLSRASLHAGRVDAAATVAAGRHPWVYAYGLVFAAGPMEHESADEDTEPSSVDGRILRPTD